MDFKYCKRCGKIFRFYKSYYCPECLDEIDREFEKVRNYIYNNPRANITIISENTGVDEKVILEFLREGRLVLSSNAGLKCEKCGAPIETGRLCDDCKWQLKEKIGYRPPVENSFNGNNRTEVNRRETIINDNKNRDKMTGNKTESNKTEQKDRDKRIKMHIKQN